MSRQSYSKKPNKAADSPLSEIHNAAFVAPHVDTRISIHHGTELVENETQILVAYHVMQIQIVEQVNKLLSFRIAAFVPLTVQAFQD